MSVFLYVGCGCMGAVFAHLLGPLYGALLAFPASIALGALWYIAYDKR